MNRFAKQLKQTAQAGLKSENAFDRKLGRRADLRQRSGRSGFLVGEPAGPAADGKCGREHGGSIRVHHNYAADGPADVGANQTARPVPLPELPEHDQTVAERADGAGASRAIKTMMV